MSDVVAEKVCYFNISQVMDLRLGINNNDGSLLKCKVCGNDVKDHTRPDPESTVAAGT